MKKLLVLGAVLALSLTSVYAQNSGFKSLKNSIKQDVQSTRSAIKKDIANKQAENKKAQQNVAAQKKAEKAKQIDAKLTDLKAQLKEVQSSNTMTETEKTLRTNTLNKQIKFWENQKAALK